MLRRLFATAIWFGTIWFAYEVAWSVTQVPRIFGPMIAISVAAFVFVDPASWFWPSTAASHKVDTHQSFDPPVSTGVVR
jgi:hypothetical protein